MAGRKPPGNPVQVIKLVPDQSKGENLRLLKLQTQVLRDIVSTSENYSVAVIAIAGAARGGKSFILTYLLRYLQALEKSPDGNAGDWMGRENPTTSMKGKGFDFRNGIDRTTDGIWMWSRPFIIKRASSPEPIAVIVIDTEGCFDACSSEREQSSIVGLALLASSCFIFNESTKINENTLLTLSKFMQYGQLASQSFQAKAFQRLMFLVRDWNMPHSFGFGAAGGKGFMEKCFQTSTPNMTKEAVKCREMIRNNFEDYDAYLMPHPGDDVISDEFTGSVGEMKENFREHVERFIVNLVEDISPKKIGQTPVEGKSYFDLLCKYVEEFNSPDLPDPASIVQATMLIALEAETSKHIRNYKEAFEQKLSTEPGPFLGKEALEKIHNSIKKKQMQNYSNKLGSEQERQAFRQKAEQGMDACFLQVCQRNASKQEEFITACEAETLQNFKNYMISNVTSVKQYWNFEEFNGVVSMGEKRAEEKFLEVAKSSPEGFLKKQLPPFQQKLSEIKMGFWKELQAVRKSTEDEIAPIIEEIVDDYGENLSLSIADRILAANTLQKQSVRGQESAFKKFDRKVQKKFTDEEIILEFKTLLSNKLQQKFEEIANDNQEKLEKYLAQITEDINDATDVLKEDAERCARSSDLSSLDVAYQEVYEASLNQLEDLKILDRKLYTEYQQKMKSALDAVLSEGKQSIQVVAATKQEESQGLVKCKVKEFTSQLLSLMQETQDPFEDELLQQEVNSIRIKVQQSLTKSLQEKYPGNVQQFLDEFENIATKEAKKVDQQNFERKKRFENSAADKVRALKEEYSDRMKEEERACKSSADLLHVHQTLSSELTQRLKGESLQKPSKLTVPWEESLKFDLEKIFEKATATLEIKLGQRKHLRENAIRDAVASFEEQGKDYIQKHHSLKKSELVAKLEELDKDVTQDFQGLVNMAYEADSREKRKIMSKFQDEIDDLKDELKLYAKKCQQKYNDAIERIVDECLAVADRQVQYINQSLELSNAETLKQEFDAIKNLTKESFENLWTFDNQSQLKDSAWDQILQTIEPRITKASALLSSKFEEEKKQLTLLMDQVILRSLASIKEPLSEGKAYPASNFEDAIAKMKANAEEHYKKQAEAVNLQSTKNMLDQFERKIEAEKENLRRRNTDNIAVVTADAKRQIQAHVDVNRSSIKTKSDLDELINVAEGKGKEYLKEKCMEDPSVHTELLKAIETVTETLKNAVQQEILSSRNETEILEEAVKVYNKYMHENVEGKSNVSAKMLADHHKLAVEVSISKCSRGFGLSSETEIKIHRLLRLTLEICDKKIALEAGQDQSDIAIGIDLGTTTCCVAVYRNGKAQVLKNKYGLPLTPSYVYFPTEGEPVIGTPAKEQAHLKPEQTVFDSKRLIGRTFSDQHVQKDRETWPFEVRAGKGDRPEIVVNDKPYPPESISSLLLSHMRNVAMEALGHEVNKAVITVPANFDDRQRDATRQAAQIAGLEVLQIINEPTAAAMAYAINWKDVNKKVLVFDFGGGTFDVTILEAIGADLKVLTTLGDTHLGGEDMDSNMMDFCVEKFEEEHSIELMEIDRDTIGGLHGEETVRKRMQRLRARCEITKQYLTTAPNAAVDVAAIYGDKDLHVEITREEFNRINSALFEKAIETVHEAIKKAKLKKEDIKEVLMVGGSSRIPCIQEMLKEFLGHKNLTLNQDVDIQEAVALGASIQACILNGGTSAMNLIKDVQPYSLGIKTVTGVSVIIPKDSLIPFEEVRNYTTTEDNQKEVKIEIITGDDPVAMNNKSLGSFVLGGIPPGLARTQDVEIKMRIDASGILSVTAVCLSNGASKNLFIQENRGRLSEEELKDRTKVLELPPPPFIRPIFTD